MDHNSEFNPNWASNPGETIAEILDRKKMTVSQLATAFNWPAVDIKKLMHGNIPISEEIAERLSESLGGSRKFWVNLQRLYDHYASRVRDIEEKRWLKELPVSQMKKNGWVDASRPILDECLRFFNVPDVWSWRKKYSDVTALALFRNSRKFKSSPAAVATWIRQGERQAEKLSLNKWDPELFKLQLSEIKKLTGQKDPFLFLENLRSICSNCGVALAIVPTPEGCSASGAAKFLDTGNGLIIMSFRYGTDDHFWFTFFHEAAHLLMHGDRETYIDENVQEPGQEKEEYQANEFAIDVLLPGEIKDELRQLGVSEASIRKVANKAGVSLGIIVGQLQFLQRIRRNHFNGFKRTFDKKEIFRKFQSA